jgi:hypothetical protein
MYAEVFQSVSSHEDFIIELYVHSSPFLGMPRVLFKARLLVLLTDSRNVSEAPPFAPSVGDLHIVLPLVLSVVKLSTGVTSSGTQ